MTRLAHFDARARTPRRSQPGRVTGSRARPIAILTLRPVYPGDVGLEGMTCSC